MPDNSQPTKAPYVIFGSMLGIAIICVGAVLYMHSQRAKPYMDMKVRKVKRMKRPGKTAESVQPKAGEKSDKAREAAEAKDAEANKAKPQ